MVHYHVVLPGGVYVVELEPEGPGVLTLGHLKTLSHGSESIRQCQCVLSDSVYIVLLPHFSTPYSVVY